MTAAARAAASTGGPRRVRAAGTAAIACAIGLLPGAAAARSSVSLPYAAGDVWPAAVRFLRVDRSYKINEKDEAAGYVLFDFPEGGRTYRAALELVSSVDGEGRDVTQAVLSLPDLPRRYETALLNRLATRVREERGPPAPPRRRPGAGDGAERDKAKSRDGSGKDATLENDGDRNGGDRNGGDRNGGDRNGGKDRESGKTHGAPPADAGLPRIPTLESP